MVSIKQKRTTVLWHGIPPYPGHHSCHSRLLFLFPSPVCTCRRSLFLGQAVGRKLSPRRHCFDFSLLRMGFVMVKLALGQVLFYRIHSSIS